MKENKHANITCKKTVHKEHHSLCMQQPFASIVAFFERCVALLPNFKENPPMYVLNDFRNHSIPVGKM